MVHDYRIGVQVVELSRFERVRASNGPKLCRACLGCVLRAVAADAAERVVGVADRRGVLSRGERGERIGKPDRHIVRGARDQHWAAAPLLRDHAAEEAVVRAVERQA